VFAVAQGLVLIAFVWFGFLAVHRFRPATGLPSMAAAATAA